MGLYQESLNVANFGVIKQCEYMVVLREFPEKKKCIAWVGKIMTPVYCLVM